MAVAGEDQVEDASPPEDATAGGAAVPPGPEAPGPPPGRRRALALALPALVGVLLILAVGLGYKLGDGATPVAVSNPTPTNTLKPQPVDVGFAADMYDHHEQAVQMSLMVIGKATDPGVRAHALQIAVGQRRESGLFQQFLLDRGIEYSDPRRTVMAWMGEPVPADQMPGLATVDQLVALNAATGVEADRLFLELMIRHHEGGIHMASYAAEHAETQSMRDLAARIVLAQQGEVNDLLQLQSELGG